TTIADSYAPLRLVYPPLARSPWYSEAYSRWRSTLLSTLYPSTTSESSTEDSSSESFAGPSRKRCRSPAATVTSSIHATRALVLSRADLLLPRKRFRDSISPEDSIDMEVDVRVNVEDEVEDEVESSDRGTIEVGVDVAVGIDIPDGILIPNVIERLEQDAAFSMSWRELMKLMAEVYCPRNEIQKMESKLWNLTVKNNDLANYTQRFQELTMVCIKMVPEEEDRVEKFIGGLPDNIQGNVILAEPTRLQDVVRIVNNLMDQKLKGQNVGGQNVARAYTAGNNEKMGYDGPLPYCNKCKLHHEGPCTVKCGKCNKVGHMARDCKNSVAIRGFLLVLNVVGRDTTGMNVPS
ncbi:reverse transcriptase domain-containing protein, partial [Tanacetum coccineum]